MTKDHPRGRGDDFMVSSLAAMPAGPPPRARGRPPVLMPGVFPGRTTPAGAGMTRSGRGRRTCPSDHPRGRGDDASRSRSYLAAVGPPPRARGRRQGQERHHPLHRTTPAGAGTTPARGPGPGRGCGPPPRARGRRWLRSAGGYLRRTTPAGAGTTQSQRHSTARLYGPPPRARGRRQPRPSWITCTGPPPRARGRRRPHRDPPPSRTEHPRGRGDDDLTPPLRL